MLYVTSSRRVGFTLVELLVVIGIIAVLVSILLPALNRARAQAATIACASNLKQVGIAIMMYRNANQDWSPPLGRYYSGSWAANGTADHNQRWFNWLEVYTKTYRVFNCPTINEGTSWSGQRGWTTMVKSRSNEPGPAPGTAIGRSDVGSSCNYAYIPFNMGYAERPTVDPDGSGSTYQVAWSPTNNYAARKYSQISTNAKMAGRTINDLLVAIDGVYMVTTLTDNIYPDLGVTMDRRYVHNRSNGQPGKINALYTDGHVETNRKDEFGRTVILITPSDPTYGKIGILYKK
jgi:prepilin-type N-terminal cleavage/methylation domain-containing protein/prepilin-type processing-associated H-X9-DG protein